METNTAGVRVTEVIRAYSYPPLIHDTIHSPTPPPTPPSPIHAPIHMMVVEYHLKIESGEVNEWEIGQE